MPDYDALTLPMRSKADDAWARLHAHTPDGGGALRTHLAHGGQIAHLIVRTGDASDAWHSNVEISADPTANIKYLYIYFTKGEDRVLCSVDDEGGVNECTRHLNAQHHAPESSVWKLLSLTMHQQSHSCFTLSLTYEGAEYIRYDEDATADEVRLAAEQQSKSNHTRGFFELNSREAAMRFVLAAAERRSLPPTTRSVTLAGASSDEPPNMFAPSRKRTRAPCAGGLYGGDADDGSDDGSDGDDDGLGDAGGGDGGAGRGDGGAAPAPGQALTRPAYLGSDDEGSLYPAAGQLTYAEIPFYYTWDTKEAQFCRRSSPHCVKPSMVSRLAVIKPSSGDVFYMRLRLLYVCCKGAASYADLKTAHRGTADATLCATFQEACIVEGLVADDSEWEHVLHAGVALKTSIGLRSLFVEVLMNCEPQRPDLLWDLFKDELADDVAKANGRPGNPRAADHNECLRLIRDKLQEFPAPKTLEQCRLPAVDETALPLYREVAEIRAERALSENREELLQRRIDEKLAQMNDGQRIVWGAVRADIDAVGAEQTACAAAAQGRAHYIYARGGYGKTFLDELILDYVRVRGGFALATASSGIASLLLEGARTVHNRFKVPLDVNEESTLGISRNKADANAQLIRKAVVLLWDECTMLAKEVLEAIDRALKDLMDNDLPFGGKLFVFTGDWAQTLPVAKGRFATVNATHLQSSLWTSVTQHELHINERVRQAQLRGEASEAARYAEWNDYLGRIGAGSIGEGVVGCTGEEHDASKLIRLPDEAVFRDAATGEPSQDLDAFIDAMYPELLANYRRDGWLCERTILAPKNDDVDAVNANVLARLPGKAVSLLSADSTTDDTTGLWSTDILNTWKPNGMPQHQLELKVGCVIILLRNLNPREGLCNGARLIVLDIQPGKVLKCRIATGKHKGKIKLIYRCKLFSTKGELPVQLCRLQFPVRLAFAITMYARRPPAARPRLPMPCLPL